MKGKALTDFLGLMACTIQDIVELMGVSCNIDQSYKLARFNVMRGQANLLRKMVDDNGDQTDESERRDDSGS